MPTRDEVLRRRAEFKQAELHRTHACGTCQAEAAAAERARIRDAVERLPWAHDTGLCVSSMAVLRIIDGDTDA